MQAFYKINPQRTLVILTMVVLILTLQSLFTEYLIENTDLKTQSDSITVLILDLASVNLEESIPTWFSTIILFVASILLWLIAFNKWHRKDPLRVHWIGLAAIFMYLSMDEGAVIHEIFADPLQEAFDTTGFFYFGWQLLAIPLLIIFGLLYLRFLLALPRKTARLFVLAGSIYVGGAIVVEGISASTWYEQGETMTYLAIATIEEFFEMLGIVVFIYSLLAYMVDMDYRFVFDGSDEDTPPEQTVYPAPGYGVRRLGVLAIIGLMLLNLAGLVWVSGKDDNAPESVPAQTVQEQLIDALETDDIFVLEMNGIFSFDNIPVQQTAITLLPYYNEVLVVSLISAERSVIFAGDDLGFDQATVTEMLSEMGQSQFIIFDKPLLQTLAPQLQTDP